MTPTAGPRPQRVSRAACGGTPVGLALAAAVLVGCTTDGTATGPAAGGTAPAPNVTAPAGTPAAARTPSPEPDKAGPTTRNRLSARERRELNRRLIAAAWKNDVAAARRLVAAGADVNAKDATEQSAYLIATSEGYLGLLELTLSSGADVRSLDSYQGTGLIRAADRGHADIVGRLLQTDIDVNHVNNLGWTALHEAVLLGDGSRRYVDTVRLLVAGGADVRLPSARDGVRPLAAARARGYDAIARALQEAADSRRLKLPDRVLLRAAAAGNADRVAVSLRSGARIEARDSRRRTALLLASTHDRVEVARLLVALGADPDALDDRHDTPWLVTGVTGSVAMMEALLPARPDLTQVNRFGGTSLIPASERGHVDYVARAVKTGIDVNHVNDLGWTALLEAVLLGDGSQRYQRVVRLLLDAGADPTIADKDGVTPLQHARNRGQDKVAGILQGAR